MFGDVAQNWRWTVHEDYPGILMAVLPPGAFIGLGMLIAIKNVIDKRLGRQRVAVGAPEPATSS